MSDKLRACPCKAGHLIIHTGPRGVLIECAACGWETERYATSAEADIAWNTRAYDAEIAAKDRRIAKLEAALRHCLGWAREDPGGLWRDVARAALDE